MPTVLAPTKWFPKNGLDLISAPHDVGMDFAQDGFDVWCKNNKNIEKRPGYDEVNVSAVSASPDITWLGSLYLSNGTKYELVGTENGDIWEDSSGTITNKRLSGLNPSVALDYTQFLDTGIWADGTTLKTWNGAVSGTINPGASAVCCEAHLNKLFVADKNSSTVRYSQTGSISSFTGIGTDAFNFEQNNGQVITALHSFARSELLIFKERSMGKLVGYDKPSFNLITVDNSVGCINKRTVQSFKSNTQGGLCVFAGQDGIYVYDGSTPKKVSEYIQEFWDGIDSQYFSEMDSTVDTDNGLYMLACPNGTTSTTNNRIIVMDLLHPFQDDLGLHFPMWIWRVNAFSLNCEVQSDNSTRCVFGEASGFKYYFSDTLLDDNGSLITAYVVTPSMTMDGVVGSDSCLRRAYVTMESSSGNMEIYGEVKDGEDWILQDSLDMSGGADRLGIDFALGISALGFTEANFSSRINMQLRSRRIKIKFEQSTDSYRFTLNSPVEFYFKQGGFRE